LTSVGLLDDKYFLYWEDADWSERIKQNGFLLKYSLESIVYHKNCQSSSSYTNAYFSTLNCFKFYRKYHPLLLPLVWISRFLFIILVSINKRDVSLIKGALRAYGDLLKIR
jgi:GT2 family glycosyltransferase